MLLERVLERHTALVHARASKGLQPGRPGRLARRPQRADGRAGTEDLFRLEFSCDVREFFELTGEMPLPPYIARRAEGADRERYQTVYARAPGAVAAPTAGPAFRRGGVCRARGARRRATHSSPCTSAPAPFSRCGSMISTRTSCTRSTLEVPQATCAAIAAARAPADGWSPSARRSCVASRRRRPTASRGRSSGETRIFIRPGYRFRVIDALLTNFHLPESTLLMLCAAFAGRESDARRLPHAVQARYRFFSYGDAMFLPRAAVMERRSGRRMSFDLLAEDGAARRGRLRFARGDVETPAFMPVGTYGTVKAMTAEELEAHRRARSCSATPSICSFGRDSR